MIRKSSILITGAGGEVGLQLINSLSQNENINIEATGMIVMKEILFNFKYNKKIKAMAINKSSIRYLGISEIKEYKY